MIEIAREIRKQPPPPHMSAEVVTLLTDLCFGTGDNTPHDSTAMLVFGTQDRRGQWQIVQRLKHDLPDSPIGDVFIVGGDPGNLGISEARVILNMLFGGQCFRQTFWLGEQSLNTLENVGEAIRLGVSRHAEIAFVAKYAHCGRCALTLKRFLPNATFHPLGYVISPEGASATLGPGSWHIEEKLRSIVWGEFLRIELYGGRGDIAYPDHIRKMVEEIRMKTGAR